jgi:ATP-dependent protease HslVU (ClpYQ) peptidase subunit
MADRGRIHIGVDSAAVSGWTRRETRLRKVFRRGPLLLGYTTSFRMGQLLEHHLEVPPQAEGQSDMAYLVTEIVERVRVLLKEKGFAKIEANNESGGQFLCGYRGRLYSIDSDFQVGEMADAYDAIGSGAEHALGAMAALAKLPPARRIRRALEVAAHFNMGVCPPFHIRSS